MQQLFVTLEMKYEFTLTINEKDNQMLMIAYV